MQFKKLLENAILREDKTRLLAAKELQSGAWLNAASITAIGLRPLDEAIRISIGLRLGSNLGEPYVSTCSKFVHTKGLHSFSGKITRHGLLNGSISKAIQSAMREKNPWASVELMERDQMV